MSIIRRSLAAAILSGAVWGIVGPRTAAAQWLRPMGQIRPTGQISARSPRLFGSVQRPILRRPRQPYNRPLISSLGVARAAVRRAVLPGRRW
jgi:hypothetical protein